ncbi:MAG: hypothetical protein QG656_422, partial [Candidatus Hydrogenedentes bacterium]|nr:hypothetical protein [Candidatus Hydrogenedentota bacterium]
LTVTETNAEPIEGEVPTRPHVAVDIAERLGKRRIGEMLIDANLITPQQLDEALTIQRRFGCKLVEALVRLQYIDLREFSRFMAKQPGIASIDLMNYQISAELVKLIPKELALRHEVFPVDRLGTLLTIGMACPLDSVAIEQLQVVTGFKIKPLLCSPKDIRDAIKRYYPVDDDYSPSLATDFDRRSLLSLQSSLKTEGVSKLVQELDSLPVLPQTLANMTLGMENITARVPDMVDIVEKDPPVAAFVLRAANDPEYGFPGRVDSLELAISLIGMHGTHKLVMAAPVFEMSYDSLFDYRTFWMEAMCCASASKAVASALGRLQHTGAYAAGLLHDIGRFVLHHVAPELYAQLDRNLTEEETIEAERDIFGISHPDAGYELASRWKLPAETLEAIRYHHTPEQAELARELVTTVAVADALTHLNQSNNRDDRDDVIEHCEDVLKLLGLDEADVQRALTEVLEIARTRHLWTRQWSSLCAQGGLM